MLNQITRLGDEEFSFTHHAVDISFEKSKRKGGGCLSEPRLHRSVWV